jgi:hypothetical protein
METVLRKVNVRDRLPIKKNYYFTLLFTNTDWKDRAVREYSPSYDNWWKENVEYWYEEVSLDELFKEKYPIRSNDKILLAKERYEKANKFLDNNLGLCTTEVIMKALKIAAGLEK